MVFIEIFNRIKNETDIKTLTLLAKFLGTTQPYISKKKKDNEFSANWAFKIAQKYSLSTDWILTGEGPKRLSLPSEKNTNYEKLSCENRERSLITEKNSSYEVLSEEKQTEDRVFRNLRDWIAELTRENPKRIYWFECVLEDRIPEYKEWVRTQEGVN